MKLGKINHISNKSIGFRFDARYHLSEGVETTRIISHSPYKLVSISQVSKDCFIGNRAKRVYVNNPDRGIPFLSSSDILKAEFDNVKYASKKYTSQIKEMTIVKGWTLISRSGTVGNCAFATAKHANKLASEHVIRLVPNNKIKEGVLYAYLASKFGFSLLTQGTFGAVIQHIEPSYVQSLPIPLFPDYLQSQVDLLIQEAATLREEADDALEEAKNTVLESLAITYVKKNISLISSKNIISSFKKRFEANFHISAGSNIECILRNKFNCINLGELCTSISRPDIFKRYYVKNGLTFLGSADIFLASPCSTKQLSLKKTENISSLQLKEGMILIPRSGTIGDVAIAHAGHANKLASEHVMRLIPNGKLKGGYIFAFLASSIGKELIKRHVFGSVIQHVESPHLSQIPIPVICDDKMFYVDQKVKEYSYKMGDAITKEKLAIKLIETEIEKWNY